MKIFPSQHLLDTENLIWKGIHFVALFLSIMWQVKSKNIYLDKICVKKKMCFIVLNLVDFVALISLQNED